MTFHRSAELFSSDWPEIKKREKDHVGIRMYEAPLAVLALVLSRLERKTSHSRCSGECKKFAFKRLELELFLLSGCLANCSPPSVPTE